MKKTAADISWTVGGQQGEGIESIGDSFATALNHLGYYLYGHRHFSSRIKGGHTHYKIRVSESPVGTVTHALNILVAFDQDTIAANIHEMNRSGVIMADAKFRPVLQQALDMPELFILPLTEIAAGHGSPLMKNSVALGATAALIGLTPADFTGVIATAFVKKSPEVLDNNLKALQGGFDFIRENGSHLINCCPLPRSQPGDRLFMLGNEAIALGALAAGAKFMAAYPITPASEIMEYMIEKLPQFGGAVIQTEDEIAACTMAIGANYAGARAFTATSGPGFSLMQEGIGLAAMTETPLVVIDTQRGGPSTGLPTKHEQSDILAAVYGTHGDAAKIVIAPGTAAEAFNDTVEAFNLAEEYQCPVILLSDLQLSLCKQTLEPPALDQVAVRRGTILAESDLEPLNTNAYFKRFEPSANGISARVLPGTENGMYLVTGLEHDAVGKPAEAPANRIAQMDKRLSKLKDLAVRFPVPFYAQAPFEHCELLVIGTGASRGAIEEAIVSLHADGYRVNHVHLRLLHPLPSALLFPLFSGAGRILVVDHNATAQLAALIRMHVGVAHDIRSLLKYDGDILRPSEVYQACREALV